MSGHDYLSTACFHDQHGYCAAMTGVQGAKRPAQCKFCEAGCRCGCHGQGAAVRTAVEPADHRSENPGAHTGRATAP